MTFTFNFTSSKLAACVPNSKIDEWFKVINTTLPSYSINSVSRVAAWLAQMAHESGDFRLLTENLNYSTRGLRATFPKYFPTDALAEQYARQPEKIANRVYGGRMGNGVESTGDGWKFRGRGLIQITGKSNYTQCSLTLYGDQEILLKNPEILIEYDGAVRSACWFWNSRSLNTFADQRDITTISRRINGGDHGLADRTQRFNRYLSILAA